MFITAPGCHPSCLLIKLVFCLLGGLGEAVSSAISMEGGIRVKRIGVTGMPRSGPANALMELYGISSSHIIKAVKTAF